MPLSGKVRVEIFIPDLPDPAYGSLLENLGNELTYAFGGCSTIPAVGKYRSTTGTVLPDNINILFTHTPFRWEDDRQTIERYAAELRHSVARALSLEESILVALYPLAHST